VILTGVLRSAASPYGKVLDVNHITQSSSNPFETFKATIKHGAYISAKCPTSPWHMKTTWTYNNNTQNTISKTQPCT
jgi:hypothetical protein